MSGQLVAAVRRRLSRIVPVTGSVVTLLIAIVGAVTGTISFVRSARVAIVLAATGPYTGVHQGARDLGVSIVNTSSQKVNLVRGTVLFRGHPMGVVTGVLSPKQPLPYTVDAGGSFAGAITWRISNAALARDMLSQWRHNAKATGLRLRLDFIPGGTKYVDVTVAAVPSFETFEAPSPVPVVLAPTLYTAGSDWGAGFAINSQRRVLGVDVFTLPRPYVLTLRIWRPLGGRVIASSQAPVVEQPVPGGMSDALLPVGRLPRGTYAFAVSDGGNVVVTGDFAIPCPHVDDPHLLKRLPKGTFVVSGACLGSGVERSVQSSNDSMLP